MIRIATRKNFHSYAELRSWSKLPLGLRDLYPSRSRTLAGNAKAGSFARGCSVLAGTVLGALLIKAENPCGEGDPESAASSESYPGRLRT